MLTRHFKHKTVVIKTFTEHYKLAIQSNIPKPKAGYSQTTRLLVQCMISQARVNHETKRKLVTKDYGKLDRNTITQF